MRFLNFGIIFCLVLLWTGNITASTTYLLYSPSKQLLAKQTDLNNDPYRTQRYSWKGDQLISTHLENDQGEILWCKTYEYNDHGDVTKQTLWGNLSGQCTSPIILQSSGLPEDNEIESYATRFEYSEDHQLLGEYKDNGTAIRYTYKPNTQLITGKLLLANNQIQLRTFYDYDENNALTTTTTDDGLSFEKNDLEGVTERKIIKQSRN